MVVGSGGSLNFRESHPYFTQIQFEMAVSGCSWADFVVFTPLEDDLGEDVFVERIHFSESWQKKLLPAVSRFFRNFVVLELLTRRVQRNVPLIPLSC